MAHKKAASSTDNGRDSNSKRLGVKLFGGQVAKAGNIIVRQRGTRFHAGENTYLGKDYTLHAKVDGVVSFEKRRFNRTFVNITPLNGEATAVATAPKAKKAQPKKQQPVEAAPAAEPAAEETTNQEVDAPAATPADTSAESAAEVVQEVASEVVNIETSSDAADTTEINTLAAVTETATEHEANTEAASEEKAVALPKGIKQDDLKIIEGVGPKIESLLQEAGLDTWAKVADASADQIKEILVAAGSRFQMHDPTTWPKQAEMASEGKFDELEAWQDELDGGR